MGGKQMQGDERERRKAAKEARDEGVAPSEASASQGAAKQRQHHPRSGDHDEKLAARDEGKRRTG